MKKIIIAGAALAAISVFTVSAFAADTSNEANTSVLSASNTASAQCTQKYCPQDGTGNRYGAENENGNGGGDVCNPSCPQDGTGNRYCAENENGNGGDGVCNPSCPQNGTGNRYGAENQNGNGGGGVCNPSCPQDGTGNRYGTDNESKNTNGKNGSCNGCQSETCTNLCNGSQQRLRLYSEK